MLLLLHLVTGPHQIPHGLVLRIGHVDGGEFAGAVETGQLIGIAAVGFDAVAGFTRHLGGGHQDAVVAVGEQTAAERITVRTGFIAEAQRGVRMGGLELFGEPQDVVVVLRNPRLDGADLVYDVDVLDGKKTASGKASALFIDVIGRPLTPLSVAGVARRSARRTVRRRT